MELCGYIGNVVIEVLKHLKGPVPLTTIISKVALQMGCQEKDLVNVVTETINGGVRFGFIQRRRERYAFVPFSFLGYIEDDTLDCLFSSQKSKTGEKKPMIAEKSIQTLYRSPKFNISLPQFNKTSKNNLTFRTYKSYNNDCKKKETISIHSSPMLKSKFSQGWDNQSSGKSSRELAVKSMSNKIKRRF